MKARSDGLAFRSPRCANDLVRCTAGLNHRHSQRPSIMVRRVLICAGLQTGLVNCVWSKPKVTLEIIELDPGMQTVVDGSRFRTVTSNVLPSTEERAMAVSDAYDYTDLYPIRRRRIATH